MLEDVLMIEMFGLSEFVTYAFVPSGVIAIPLGLSPTVIVGAITVLAAI